MSSIVASARGEGAAAAAAGPNHPRRAPDVPPDLVKLCFEFAGPDTMVQSEDVFPEWKQNLVLKRARRCAAKELFKRSVDKMNGLLNACGMPSMGGLPTVSIPRGLFSEMFPAYYLPHQVQRMEDTNEQNVGRKMFTLAFRISSRSWPSAHGVFLTYPVWENVEGRITVFWQARPEIQSSELGEVFCWTLARRHFENQGIHTGYPPACKECLTPLLRGTDPEFVLVPRPASRMLDILRCCKKITHISS